MRGPLDAALAAQTKAISTICRSVCISRRASPTSVPLVFVCLLPEIRHSARTSRYAAVHSLTLRGYFLMGRTMVKSGARIECFRPLSR